MKISNKIWLLITVLIFPLFSNAQNKELSIGECLQNIDSLWPTKQNIELNQQVLDLQIKNAKSMWLPSLTLNAQATYQSSTIKLDLQLPGVALNIPSPDKDQYKATLNINQTLWDGGLSKAQQSIYTQQQKTAGLNTQNDVNQAKKQVITLYFAILQTQQNDKVLTQTALELQTSMKSLESAVENGVSSSYNLEKLQMQALKLEQSQYEIKNAIAGLYKSLSQFLGTVVDRSTQLSLPQVPVSASQLSSTIAYQLIYSGIDQLSAQNNLLKHNRNPKLMAFAQLGYGKPGLNMLSNTFEPYYLVGITAQWQIWDYTFKNNKQIIQIQQKSLENNAQSYLKNVGAAEQSMTENLQKSDFLIAKDIEIVQKQTEIVSKANTQLQQGTISASEYLDELYAKAQAELNLEMHKIQKVKYITDYNLLNENYQF